MMGFHEDFQALSKVDPAKATETANRWKNRLDESLEAADAAQRLAHTDPEAAWDLAFPPRPRLSRWARFRRWVANLLHSFAERIDI